MPKCWSCKGSHPTVADVRACHEHGGKTTTVTTTAKDGPQWPASEPQIKYVLGLQVERRLPEGYVTKDADALRLMERDDVSASINLLKTFPKVEGKGSSGRSEYTMPAGRYALLTHPPAGGDHWSFYEVSKPTDGRWKGYTFIKRLIGAPGAYRKETMDAVTRYRMLDLIEADPRKAALDYGLQSGVCGVCSSPLTNPESLARGIGPICAGKTGWA